MRLGGCAPCTQQAPDDDTTICCTGWHACSKATWGASAPGNLLFNVVMVVKKKEIAVWGKNACLHRAEDALEANTLAAGLYRGGLLSTLLFIRYLLPHTHFPFLITLTVKNKISSGPRELIPPVILFM